MPRMREGVRRHRAILLRLVQRVLNNSQFWSWVDYWEGWDYMSDEQEDKMILEDWNDEEELFCELDPCISERNLRIIMICMECGNSLDCCIC